jgi:regulation of enolase protein 1 (concanavalin A-like superfamily)
VANVPGVPFPLQPSPADQWHVDEATGTVTVSAAPRSDIFIEPGGTSPPALNAATLLGEPPEGDFQLSARVTVDFQSTYDAGVLLLWVDDRHWGKLCFEFSPADEPMIVSVVCRGVADDANAYVVPTRTMWLRVSRVDRAYAYHASSDGKTWTMIRSFSLPAAAAPDRIGFEAQAPIGEGCHVSFDDIRFVRARLADLRDGS